MSRAPVAVLTLCVPLLSAAGLSFASPAAANPAMCAIDPTVYQVPGACPATPATAHANANASQAVAGIPCTGNNTGKCIGLQVAGQSPG